MTKRKAQSGVALITALLVVALVTLSATAMLHYQDLAIRRSANLLHGEQAWQYLLGAEAWAKRILIRDRRANNTDDLTQEWAAQLPPTLVEGGQLSGYLSDLQGRFNLRNLLKADGSPDPQAVAHLQNLLRSQELPPEWAARLLDWMDADALPQLPDGAEEDAYLLQQPAYRSADQPLIELSEVRLILDMSEEGYQQLRPLLCVLPEPTRLNVNTASPAVLLALIPSLRVTDAEALVAEAQQKGFANLSEFFSHAALAGLEIDKALFALDSDYFMLHAQADIGQVTVRLRSLLQRDQQTVRTLLRSRAR